MMVLEIAVGGQVFKNVEAAFQRTIDGLMDAAPGAVKPISRALRETLQRVAKELASKHSSSWNGQVASGKPTLQKRSGEGLASIAKSIHVTGSGSFDTLVGQISAAKLSFHEKGGTIKATRSQYLTIPLPAALDGRGVPLKQRARDWDNTFVARSKKGNLLIFRRLGRKNIVPLYLLRTEVRIPPRLKMEETVMEQLPYFERRAFAILERAIEEALP